MPDARRATRRDTLTLAAGEVRVLCALDDHLDREPATVVIKHVVPPRTGTTCLITKRGWEDPAVTWPAELAEALARGDGVLGEVVLRRRGTGPDAVHELIVNGAFMMDTVDVSTERLLADATLAAVDGDRLAVLVGGLGLGFTAAALLASPRVAAVTVVEIEPLLVRWLRASVVPPPAGLWDDDRLAVRVEDVATTLSALPAGRLDAVLLDVDNGPDFLVHESNARVYDVRALSSAARAVRAGGAVAVWSSHRSPSLARTLDAAVGPCVEHLHRVRRGGRDLQYALYVACVAP